MDTVSEYEMAMAMGKLGGMAILHRFIEAKEQAGQVKKLVEQKKQNPDLIVAASVGVKQDGMDRSDILADAGVEALTVDIAHGDSVMMLSTMEYIKKKYPHIELIAGNVAMPDGVKRLVMLAPMRLK